MGWVGTYNTSGNLEWRKRPGRPGFPDFWEEGRWKVDWWLGDGPDLGDSSWIWKWCPRDIPSTPPDPPSLWRDPSAPRPGPFSLPCASAPASAPRPGPYAR